jgi:hypothetical protein
VDLDVSPIYAEVELRVESQRRSAQNRYVYNYPEVHLILLILGVADSRKAPLCHRLISSSADHDKTSQVSQKSASNKSLLHNSSGEKGGVWSPQLSELLALRRASARVLGKSRPGD